jgi:hypothetical protein
MRNANVLDGAVVFSDQSSQFGLSHCTCSLLTLLNMVQVLSYWAIAVPVVLWYSLATPGPLAGLVEFFQGPMHANTFRCASDIGEHFALRIVNACTCFGSFV